MILQTITYPDVFTGEEVKRDFWFHLSKADVISLIGSEKDGDLEAYVQRITEAGDTRRAIDFLETVVARAIGERTPDGRFIKNKDISDQFIGSEAWGELFEKMLVEDGFVEKFIKGLTGHVSGNQSKGNLQENMKRHQGNRQQRRSNR